MLAHGLTRRLAEVRKAGELPWLRPDGKSQVTVEYEGDRPVRVATVVLSTQHAPTVSHDEIEKQVVQHVVRPVIREWIVDGEPTYHVNPTGRFVVGGPQGDAGLTGRKIIVDTYGGMARHGGGAFSGKDPSKVDRSACYAARWVAKNVVAAKLAAKCEVQFAYAIGHPDPVSVHVETFGTATVPDAKIIRAINRVFNFQPAEIIDQLNLRRPIYSKTTNYGHFGKNDKDLTWEATNRVSALLKAL
jgi:S-adenosylmethionine synthetase